MMRYLFFGFLFSSFFLGCGGSSTQEETAGSSEIQNSTQNSTQVPATTPQSTDVSLVTCIDEAIQREQKSLSTLETLSCAHLRTKDFSRLAALTALTDLTISQTPLDASDVLTLSQNLDKTRLQKLYLIEDNLTKSSVDNLSPGFDYQDGQYYTAMKDLSFQANPIEGLLVVDFFPALEHLNLEGNVYDSDRLHHIGFVNALKTLVISGNPNIEHLDNLKDGPKAEASVVEIDIRNLPNLRDISELLNFSKLQTLYVDSAENSRFLTTLNLLKNQGVNVIVKN